MNQKFRGQVFEGIGLTILYLTARVRAAERQNLPWNDPVHIPVFYTLKTQRQTRQVEMWCETELLQLCVTFEIRI